MTFLEDIGYLIHTPLSWIYGYEVATKMMIEHIFFALLCLRTIFHMFCCWWLIFRFLSGYFTRVEQVKKKVIPSLKVTCCMCESTPWVWTLVYIPFKCEDDDKHIYCKNCLKTYLKGCRHTSLNKAKCKCCNKPMKDNFSV